MTVDPTVVPGLLLLAAELIVLAAVGYVVVRLALRQADERVALAQGLVVGLALWGLIVNFVMYAVPGLAGAIVGWGVVLAIGAVLVWRAPHPIWPQPRVAAGFAVALLVLLWIALASRQLLSIPDPGVRLGLAASIRAGIFPPELSWNPGTPVFYHHGVPLLAGLLTPPVGPDLAFVTELLGAYAWASFALVVTTMLWQRSSRFAATVTAPLLLAAGAWTFTWVGDGLVTAPVPVGLPAAGLRTSLADIYWPSVDLSWAVYVWEFRETALANIWKPGFLLAYALVLVVLERASRATDGSWRGELTLAGLVGFVGLLTTTLAPVALALWTGLNAVSLSRGKRVGMLAPGVVLRSGAGPALAVLLLLGSGGVLAGTLWGDASPSLALAWNAHQQGGQLLGQLDSRPGGVGLLGVGPVVLAGAAVLLARRDRLVLTLAIGTGVLAVAYMVLDRPPASHDTGRLAGHARNLALAALLLALSVRLARLPQRWRYVASGLLIALVVWPTIAGPLRHLGGAVSQGTEVANAAREPREWMQGRYSLDGRFPSDQIATYIRNHTPVDARVLTIEPPYTAVAFATGRPSGAGFIGHLHFDTKPGPEYLDAVRHLEPTALRRLSIAYVHATDAWIAELTDQAAGWLNDPRLFEPLIRSEGEALYRVRPAFVDLAAAPAPASFEALRQAVPASASAYFPAEFASPAQHRVAAALAHARLLGDIDPRVLYLLTPWPSEPLGDRVSDLVVLPLSVEPWMLPPEGRQPIWWNAQDGIAVYAPNGAVAPIMAPPASMQSPEPSPVGVQVSDVGTTDGRLTFTVTIDDLAPDQWSGQDWQLLAGEESPWAIPTELEPDGRTPVVAQWFAGQMAPRRDVTTYQYVFDPRTPRLAVGERGQATDVASAGDGVGEGIWMLSLRLIQEVDRGTYVAQEDIAVIPLLQIEISETGDVTVFVYDDARGVDAEPAVKP